MQRHYNVNVLSNLLKGKVLSLCLTCSCKRRVHQCLSPFTEKSLSVLNSLLFLELRYLKRTEKSCPIHPAKPYKLFPQQAIWKTGLHLICLWMLNNAGFISHEAQVKEEPGEREEQRRAERLEMNCQESSQDRTAPFWKTCSHETPQRSI